MHAPEKIARPRAPLTAARACGIAAALLIALYTVAFCTACHRKYTAFLYYDHDTAIMNQVFWNCLHGRLLYSSITGGSLLKSHGNLTALLLVPLYALWQSPLFLLYLQTFSLALAGWPIYLVARRETASPPAALVFLLLYLLYPALGHLTLHHFCMENFAVLLLAWSWYFFRAGRYPPFIAFLLAAVLTREEISFIAVALGVAALWERRTARWWLAPIAAGCAWFAVYFLIVLPRLQGDPQAWYLSFYRQARPSAGGIASWAVSHPSGVLRAVVRSPKTAYIVRMLPPLSFLPLLAPGLLFIPSPVVLLYLASSHPETTTILRHYNAPFIPFIFAAAAAGYARIRARVPWRAAGCFLQAALLASGLCASRAWGPQLHLASPQRSGGGDYLTPRRWEMVRMVPPLVPAAATYPFFTPLSNRRELESLAWVLFGRIGLFPGDYRGRNDIECALIDFGDPTTFVRYYDPRESPGRFARYLKENNLGLVRMCDQIGFFRRGARDIFPLYERLRAGSPAHPLAIFEEAALVESSVTPEGGGGYRQVRFVSAWRADRTIGEDLSLVLRIADARGTDCIPHQVRNICYHLYPANEWGAGETIRATHLIALPPDLPAGHYALKMAVIGKFPPCRARRCAAGPGRAGRDGWYVAGEFAL